MKQVLTGFHAIEEQLRGSTRGHLYLSRGGKRYDIIVDLARKSGIPIDRVTTAELDRICSSKDHRGIAFIVEEEGASPVQSLDDFLNNLSAETSLVVILDGITDPHNFGAILRSCDLFRVDLVITQTRRSAGFSQTVAKTSAGASAFVPVAFVSNLPGAMKSLQREGFWIYGADMRGKSADEIDLSGKCAIVMGGEGKGMGRLVADTCDGVIGIHTEGNIDSLNVSVATGILLYEADRQRRAGAKNL